MPLSSLLPLFLLPILFLPSSSLIHASPAVSRADSYQTDVSQLRNFNNSLPTTLKLSLPVLPSNQTLNKFPLLHLNDSVSFPSSTSAQIAQIYNLRTLNSHLEQSLHLRRHENLRANNSLQVSKSRAQQIRSQRDQLLQSRRRIQNQLDLLHARLLRYDTTLGILRGQVSRAIRDIERLRTKKFWLLQHLQRLDDDLREKGLERWVGGAVKSAINPAVADALVHGTASVVEPVLEGIERFAEVEGHLEDNMKGRLRTRVPLVDKPFYSGFVTYTVLLCPLVLVLSVLVRIRRRMAKISSVHIVILTNFYFTVLCAGCFYATVIGKVDVLLTLRAMNRHVFDAVMLMHGGIYIPHILLHATVAAKTRSVGSVSHIVAITVIGLHCFVHLWRHAARHEDPHVDRHAYLFYTALFGFVLYDLTVQRIYDAHRKKAMALINTSIMKQTKDLNTKSSDAMHSTGTAFSVTEVSLYKRERASVKDDAGVSQSLPLSSMIVEGRSRVCAIPEASIRVAVDQEPPVEHVEIDTVAARNL